MKLPVDTPEQLGALIRSARKAQRLRQDDVAGIAGSSHVFVRDVERGKPTVQLGKVLDLLRELGIRLVADVPDSPGSTSPLSARPKRPAKPDG